MNDYCTDRVDAIAEKLAKNASFRMVDLMNPSSWTVDEFTNSPQHLGRTSVFFLEKISRALQNVFVPYEAMTRTLTETEKRKHHYRITITPIILKFALIVRFSR